MQSQGSALQDLCIVPKGLKNMKGASFTSVESPFSLGIQISRLPKILSELYLRLPLVHLHWKLVILINLSSQISFLLWKTGCIHLHGALHVWLNVLYERIQVSYYICFEHIVCAMSVCLATNGTDDFSQSHSSLLETFMNSFVFQLH